MTEIDYRPDARNWMPTQYWLPNFDDYPGVSYGLPGGATYVGSQAAIRYMERVGYLENGRLTMKGVAVVWNADKFPATDAGFGRPWQYVTPEVRARLVAGASLKEIQEELKGGALAEAVKGLSGQQIAVGGGILAAGLLGLGLLLFGGRK